MQKFQALTSKVIPLDMNDIDTDLIIPAQFLTSISQQGYGQNLFRRLRDSDPQFPFNQEKYRGASILAAGNNFGCGSSREHAVWALLSAGIRVVVARSFADIFSNNSAKNGLLLVVLPEAVVNKILAQARLGDYTVTVNLKDQCIILPGGEQYTFTYDPFRKHCLSKGLDDMDYLLSFRQKIEQFHQGARSGFLNMPANRVNKFRQSAGVKN